MNDFDYLVLGGGVGGLAAFFEIVKKGGGSVVLLEGRDVLMYTLTWMKYFPFGISDEDPRYTGVDFRKQVLFEVENLVGRDGEMKEAEILMGARVFKIDRDRRVVYARKNDGSGLKIGYRNLVIAVGATQIVYGKYLLPGVRSGRVFSAYQVDEMLEHYPFLPGRSLVVFGESEYTLEVALAAYDRGIKVSVVSPGERIMEMIGKIPGGIPDGIGIYTNCILKQLLGNVLFKGLVVQQGAFEFCIPGDSLAIDGEFVLEHPWREHLGVEWNLDRWEVDMDMEGMRESGILFVGDAKKPSPNFVLQYERTKESVGEYLERKRG